MTEKRFVAHIDNLYPVRITGILDKSTNTDLTVFDEVVDCLNNLNEENKELKQFKEKVLMLLDEKIRYYMKQPCLAVRLPVDCEYRHSCLHNNSINVCNKAKENAYRELEKELGE